MRAASVGSTRKSSKERGISRINKVFWRLERTGHGGGRGRASSKPPRTPQRHGECSASTPTGRQPGPDHTRIERRAEAPKFLVNLTPLKNIMAICFPHTHLFPGETTTVVISGPHIQVLSST
jgi:hypothetical protein